MANAKITALTEQTTLDDTSDVLPIVDISANATEKVTWGTIRTTIATYLASLSQTLTNKDISDTTNTYRQATTSLLGALEIATVAEVEAGTDNTRAVTPDNLAGSNLGERIVELLVSPITGDALTTGDGQAYFRVPSSMGGMDLVEVAAHVTTASSSGIPTVQIRNATQTADMLTTKLTIDANETDSSTAATAAVIDTANDDVATNDIIFIDVDVAGTGTKGLLVQLIFRLP